MTYLSKCRAQHSTADGVVSPALVRERHKARISRRHDLQQETRPSQAETSAFGLNQMFQLTFFVFN